jgi:hypothetical protein
MIGLAAGRVLRAHHRGHRGLVRQARDLAVALLSAGMGELLAARSGHQSVGGFVREAIS